MATMRPTQIVLLDEHVAALDPRTAAFVLELTARIITENRLTALMVTHSMEQAVRFGDRTWYRYRAPNRRGDSLIAFIPYARLGTR